VHCKPDSVYRQANAAHEALVSKFMRASVSHESMSHFHELLSVACVVRLRLGRQSSVVVKSGFFICKKWRATGGL
jgi:hypothetical protein